MSDSRKFGRLRAIVRKMFQMVHLESVYKYSGIAFRAWITGRRYAKVLDRIRGYAHDRKLKVLFWVHSAAKWKTQSLYDAMAASSDFEPLVVLSLMDDEIGSEMDATRQLGALEAFFRKRGCRCEIAYDAATRAHRDLRTFAPDIVFFQEPCVSNVLGQSVDDVSHYALGCYVPYSAMSGLFGNSRLDFCTWFHDQLFLEVSLNEELAAEFRREYPQWMRAGYAEGLGHTFFDDVREGDCEPLDESVIYAPHFSFPTPSYHRPLHLATFDWSGRFMLEYAKSHPEVKWIFKPHPNLRRELSCRGLMTQREVDAYYAEWERIATCCYDGDYLRLFQRSRAMITDCGSFLIEYASTLKPLIRMIPSGIDVTIRPQFSEVCDQFYNVHDREELAAALDEVVLGGNDPYREKRVRAVMALGLANNTSAAERIVGWLRERCRQ